MTSYLKPVKRTKTAQVETYTIEYILPPIGNVCLEDIRKCITDARTIIETAEMPGRIKKRMMLKVEQGICQIYPQFKRSINDEIIQFIVSHPEYDYETIQVANPEKDQYQNNLENDNFHEVDIVVQQEQPHLPDLSPIHKKKVNLICREDERPVTQQKLVVDDMAQNMFTVSRANRIDNASKFKASAQFALLTDSDQDMEYNKSVYLASKQQRAQDKTKVMSDKQKAVEQQRINEENRLKKIEQDFLKSLIRCKNFREEEAARLIKEQQEIAKLVFEVGQKIERSDPLYKFQQLGNKADQDGISKRIQKRLLIKLRPSLRYWTEKSKHKKDIQNVVNNLCCLVPEAEVTQADVCDEILDILKLDYPELWFIDNNVTYTNEDNITIKFNFICENSEILNLNNQIQYETNRCLHNRDLSKLSDIQLLFYLQSYIDNNIQFNWTYQQCGQSSDLAGMNSKNIIGGLVCHECVSGGYAAVFKYFCDRLGINCISLSGTAFSFKQWTAHSWNMVEAGGQWYHFDACWNSCHQKPRYFNLPFSAMHDHRVEEKISMLIPVANVWYANFCILIGINYDERVKYEDRFNMSIFKKTKNAHAKPKMKEQRSRSAIAKETIKVDIAPKAIDKNTKFVPKEILNPTKYGQLRLNQINADAKEMKPIKQILGK